MALPSYVGKTAYVNSSTGTLTLDFSATGRQAGDWLVAIFETPNRTLGSQPTGWQQFASSPQATGSAGAAGAVRLAAYRKLSDGTETTVAFTTNGSSHSIGLGFAIRGADQTNPINFEAGGVLSTAGTSFVWPGGTTTVNDCLVVNLLANDRDASSTANLSSVVNASLANLTLRHDQTSTTDAGGGVAFITGEKATAGTVDGTTATNAASNTAAFITFAVRPPVALSASVAPASASSAHGATPVLVGSRSPVITASAQAVQTASPVVLASRSSVSPIGAMQAHRADPVAIQSRAGIAPASSMHGMLAEPVTLMIAATIAITGAMQVHRAGETTIGAKAQIAVASAWHVARAVASSIAARWAIVPAGAQHVATAQSPAIAYVPEGPDYGAAVARVRITVSERASTIAVGERTDRISVSERTDRISVSARNNRVTIWN